MDSWFSDSIQSFGSFCSFEEYSSGIGLSVHKKPCFDDLLSPKNKTFKTRTNPLFPRGLWSSESSLSLTCNSEKKEISVGLFDSPAMTGIIATELNVAQPQKRKIGKDISKKPKAAKAISKKPKANKYAKRRKRDKKINTSVEFKTVIPDFSEFDNYELIIERGPSKREKISNENLFFKESLNSKNCSPISHVPSQEKTFRKSLQSLRNKSKDIFELTNSKSENIQNESVDIFNSTSSNTVEKETQLKIPLLRISRLSLSQKDNTDLSNVNSISYHHSPDVNFSKKLPNIQTSTPQCNEIIGIDFPIIDNITTRKHVPLGKKSSNSNNFLDNNRSNSGNSSLEVSLARECPKKTDISSFVGLSARKLCEQSLSEALIFVKSKDIFESSNSIETEDNTSVEVLNVNSTAKPEVEKENLRSTLARKVISNSQTRELNFSPTTTLLKNIELSAMHSENITKRKTGKSLRDRVCLSNTMKTRFPLKNIRNTSTPLSSQFKKPVLFVEKLLESSFSDDAADFGSFSRLDSVGNPISEPMKPCEVVLTRIPSSEIVNRNSSSEISVSCSDVQVKECSVVLSTPSYLENSLAHERTLDSLDDILDSFMQVDEFSAEQKILILCDQNEVKEFKTLMSRGELRTAEKIGEGCYGEVYKVKFHDQFTVLKIVPVEGINPNGEVQLSFSDVLSELIISKEINSLSDCAPVFIEVKSISLVRGKFPNKLLTEWKRFDKERNSENDYPGDFKNDQLFVVFQYSYGGQDLENFTFVNAEQILSLLKQIVYGIAVSETAMQFEHRDLHEGNVLVLKTNSKYINFVIEGKTVTCPSNGLVAKIIDFTLSRLEKDNVPIYKDLTEQGIFSGHGDSQYDVYRSMRNATKGDWQGFYPITNVLWLTFLMTRLRTRHKKHLKKGTVAYRTLTNWINSIKKCSSTLEFVKKHYF